MERPQLSLLPEEVIEDFILHLSCRKCHSRILKPSHGLQTMALPSTGWVEMMEYWNSCVPMTSENFQYNVGGSNTSEKDGKTCEGGDEDDDAVDDVDGATRKNEIDEADDEGEDEDDNSNVAGRAGKSCNKSLWRNKNGDSETADATVVEKSHSHHRERCGIDDDLEICGTTDKCNDGFIHTNEADSNGQSNHDRCKNSSNDTAIESKSELKTSLDNGINKDSRKNNDRHSEIPKDSCKNRRDGYTQRMQSHCNSGDYCHRDKPCDGSDDEHAKNNCKSGRILKEDVKSRAGRCYVGDLHFLLDAGDVRPRSLISKGGRIINGQGITHVAALQVEQAQEGSFAHYQHRHRKQQQQQQQRSQEQQKQQEQGRQELGQIEQHHQGPEEKEKGKGEEEAGPEKVDDKYEEGKEEDESTRLRRRSSEESRETQIESEVKWRKTTTPQRGEDCTSVAAQSLQSAGNDIDTVPTLSLGPDRDSVCNEGRAGQEETERETIRERQTLNSVFCGRCGNWLGEDVRILGLRLYKHRLYCPRQLNAEDAQARYSGQSKREGKKELDGGHGCGEERQDAPNEEQQQQQQQQQQQPQLRQELERYQQHRVSQPEEPQRESCEGHKICESVSGRRGFDDSNNVLDRYNEAQFVSYQLLERMENEGGYRFRLVSEGGEIDLGIQVINWNTEIMSNMVKCLEKDFQRVLRAKVVYLNDTRGEHLSSLRNTKNVASQFYPEHAMIFRWEVLREFVRVIDANATLFPSSRRMVGRELYTFTAFA